MIFCGCSKKIKNLERQLNAILPQLVQRKDLDAELKSYNDAMRVNVNKAIMGLASEAARTLVQNVRSGNESINFIQEIVTRIKALQMDLKPAAWELHGLDKVAEKVAGQPPSTVVK